MFAPPGVNWVVAVRDNAGDGGFPRSARIEGPLLARTCSTIPRSYTQSADIRHRNFSAPWSKGKLCWLNAWQRLTLVPGVGTETSAHGSIDLEMLQTDFDFIDAELEALCNRRRKVDPLWRDHSRVEREPVSFVLPARCP